MSGVLSCFGVLLLLVLGLVGCGEVGGGFWVLRAGAAAVGLGLKGWGFVRLCFLFCCNSFWVLSGGVGGGVILGCCGAGAGVAAVGLRLKGWGFGRLCFCFCCDGLVFVGYGGGWVILGC